MRDAILRQKKEKEYMLEKDFVEREIAPNFNKYIDKDIIKVITGGRRCGKSVFCFLALKNKKFGYVNLDEIALQSAKDYEDIIKYIHEFYGPVKTILLDEVQNLDKWELWVNSLHRQGYNLIITGSNAKLLSRELATHLTGRHIAFEMFPFSFKEYLTSKKFKHKTEYTSDEIGLILNHLKSYIETGGFPEVVIKEFDRQYLQNLFDSIILKDVVRRYNVKYPDNLYNLAKVLISSFSQEISYTKLKNMMKIGSVHTVQNYVRYISDTYLIFSIKRFSFKQKEQINLPQKLYIVDNGIINALAFTFTENIGRFMENTVAVELLRRKSYQSTKQEIYYFKDKLSKEVDFVIKDGIKVNQLIQVCHNINEPNTKERELKALISASNELNCNNLLIITWDYDSKEKYKDKSIKYIPLWKWLLE